MEGTTNIIALGIARHWHQTVQRLGAEDGLFVPGQPILWDDVAPEGKDLLLHSLEQLMLEGVIVPGPMATVFNEQGPARSRREHE